MLKRLLVLVLLAGLVYVGRQYFFPADHGSAGAETLYGNVDIRELSLAFRVGGRVAEVLIDEGAEIKAGEVLAKLDSEPLRNNLRAASATVAALEARNRLLHKGYRKEDIAQAKAKLMSAQVALREAEQHLERQRGLIADAATTQHALDAAQAQRDQARSVLTAQTAQLELLQQGFRAEELAESDALLQQARVTQDTAQLALNDSTLIAPSAGIVLTRSIETGSMVQNGATAFSVSLTQPVWVRAYVAEPQLGRFASGTPVKIWTDSRPERAYQGVVGFVSPTAEFTPKAVETADLRTALVYRLRIVVQDADSLLRQGMPVTIRRDL